MHRTGAVEILFGGTHADRDGRDGDRVIPVFNPYTGERIGSVPKATLEEVREAFEVAHACQPKLTRADRAGILTSGRPR